MSNMERKVRKLHFAIVPHNTVSVVGTERGAPMRELVRMATGVGIQSGHGPACVGRWTLCTGTFPDSATVCEQTANALDCTDPYADHAVLTARAAAHFGCPTADILVSRCDREAMEHLLSALGAADTNNATLLPALEAWRKASKGDGKASNATDSNDAPRVSSKRASAPTAPRSNAATFCPATAAKGLRAVLQGIARQAATAYVVASDNAMRGALGLLGRDLAALLDNVPSLDGETTYSLRADITIGASVTGKRLDNGETFSGTVAKLSPSAVVLCERDADDDRIMLARDSAVATIDSASVNDALSIWGFAPEAPAMPESASAESSGSIDPTNIGAAPTLADVAALEARAEADAADIAAAPVDTSTTAPLDTSKRGKGRKGA